MSRPPLKLAVRGRNHKGKPCLETFQMQISQLLICLKIFEAGPLKKQSKICHNFSLIVDALFLHVSFLSPNSKYCKPIERQSNCTISSFNAAKHKQERIQKMNKICIRLRKDRTHAETIAIEVPQKHNPEKQILYVLHIIRKLVMNIQVH